MSLHRHKATAIVTTTLSRCSIHDEANHARRPPRIPPSRNDHHEGIARKERQCDYDFTAMTAALLAQLRVINFVAVERETVQRQCRAVRFELRAGPIPHGASLSCV